MIPCKKILLNGYKAADQFKAGYRLDSYGIFNRTNIKNGFETWANPVWFEEICDNCEELKNLANEATDMDPEKVKKVQTKLFELFTQVYISGMIKKFKRILPDLALYFAAGEDSIGLIGQIRKEFNQGSVSNNPSEKVVENYDIHRL